MIALLADPMYSLVRRSNSAKSDAIENQTPLCNPFVIE